MTSREVRGGREGGGARGDLSLDVIGCSRVDLAARELEGGERETRREVT
jgi:hypothetical protein